jgi:drug/metabolite transporter (DMT)-like permease
MRATAAVSGSVARRDLLLLALAAACWGLGTVVSKRAIDEMSRTPGMDVNNPSLVVDAWALQDDGATACLQPPTVATPCFVTVSIQYQFHTIVPWPLIPNTANFDRSTTMRTFY